MQEQHPYKITPDQAWEKFIPILEEAMPVKSNKRRFPLLWWSSSFVVVVAVMGFLLLDSKPITSSLPASTGNETIAPIPGSNQTVSPVQINSSLPAKVNSEADNEPIVNPENQTIQPQQTSNKKQEQPTSIDKTRKSPAGPEKSDIKKKTIPMAIAEDPVLNEELKSTSPTIIEETSLAMEEAYAVEELTTGIAVITPDQALRDDRMVDPIPHISSISILETESSDQSITVKSGKRKSHTPFIEPTLAIGGLAGLHGGIGLFGGAGANLNIARRFSVTTSIGYLSFLPNAILKGNLESLDANAGYNWIVNYDPSITGNETYVDAENVNNRAGYNAINPLVDKITQWQVSAGLKWKLTPRFFTEGGVQFGFSTQAYSEYPIVDFEQSGASSPALKINNSLDEYDVIRTSTASLYLGIGYRFGQHLDVFSNWNHGLHQYILNDSNSILVESDTEERTDYIRGLSVGLRYTL